MRSFVPDYRSRLPQCDPIDLSGQAKVIASVMMREFAGGEQSDTPQPWR